MEQTTIFTCLVEDGLVQFSVFYPATAPLKTVQQAARSLTSRKGSLFISANLKGRSDGQCDFVAVMNPGGSTEVILKNIAVFREQAERLTGMVCCVNMEGFCTKPSQKRRRASRRPVN